MRKIFIITGDYSGDIHASNVAKELKSIYNDVIIEGVGGKNLEDAGVKLFANQDKMGKVGLSPRIVAEHLTLGKKIVDYLENDFKPDVVLLIDYGTFNLSIARVINHKFKVFYFIPPQIWASRKWRMNTVKKFVDKVLCIFPFEKELYEKEGVPTHFCGHPLVKQLPVRANREEFFARHGLDINKPLVSVFPGSRTFELQQLMKTFVKSAKELKRRHPDVQICISHAPNLPDKVFDKYLKDTDFKVIKGENHALLSSSDALILASGTVALEAALYHTPMMIAYRGPWLFYFVYLLVRCIKKVSLPNIITDKNIVPEIIQGGVNVDNIVTKVEKLLYDKVYREENIALLGEVRAMLSDKNSAYEAANVIKQEFMEIDKQQING